MPDKIEIEKWFRSLQLSIISDLEELDGKEVFKIDEWVRKGGGGGISRVIENGALIEKGGVNFSAVQGETPEKILEALSLEGNDFYATGVSIVLHPSNPHVPIIHMNVRYFEMSNGTYWFGGGIDVTPHYISQKDAIEFHQLLKSACDEYDLDYYKRFKKWADDYFYIKHRKETRGIGGIFFDRLTDDNNHSKEQIFEFVKSIGKSFVPAYSNLVKDNRRKTYTDKEKNWQLLRRGRYVEFNLVYDKGTKFGLDTDGRAESILMSLPETASWQYNFQAEKNSPEEYTLSNLRKEIDWVNLISE